MSDIILKVENISKQYRLGVVGTGTLSHDLKRWAYKLRGKDDPYLKIGDTNDRSKAAESDYVWAIKDINFEVKRGEVLGIIGKNGAGKSTLLKILSRVTSPTTGEIKTKGRIASLLEVGTGFHPELTGKENIYLNGAILGMTKAEIKAKEEEIIEFSGCERYINTPVKRYSSGMRVRLAFAVAAFLEPDILVVDEVLAVGDAEFQKKAVGKMQDISKGDGRTVLFVSHNMAAVKSLCTRTLVLEHGKIVFEGDTSEAINFYHRSSYGNVTNKIDNVKRANSKLGKQLRFSEIIINSDGGNQNTDLMSGENCYFKLVVKNPLGDVFKSISFTVSVFNIDGSFLFACRSDVINKVYDIDSQSSFLCKIDRLPLNSGEYFVNINCSSNNVMLDSLHEATSFYVNEGDFYGYGKIPAKNRRGVFINYDWQ